MHRRRCRFSDSQQRKIAGTPENIVRNHLRQAVHVARVRWICPDRTKTITFEGSYPRTMAAGRMTKPQIIARLAEETELPKKQAAHFTQVLTDLPYKEA